LDPCSQCGYRAISFCACRHRHCPKCQTNARNQWLAARSQELLGTSYFQIVFTLPHQLSGLALQNKTILDDLLFRASAETLLEVAAGTSGPKSASSACCIVGDKTSKLILTCTA
jgi:hypothetical protein